MKKARIDVILTQDSVKIADQVLLVRYTTLGHIIVDIRPTVCDPITSLAMVTGTTLDEPLLTKLHKQIGHCSGLKLRTLLKEAGYSKECLQLVEQVCATCTICQQYGSTPSHPVESMPLSRSFNDVIAKISTSCENCEVLSTTLISLICFRGSVRPKLFTTSVLRLS